MSTSPRFRFAPSPTGFFHVGGARTALYNWALAKRLGGTFVLRIEDTDEARNQPEWTQGIIDALAWIGVRQDDPGDMVCAAGHAASSRCCRARLPCLLAVSTALIGAGVDLVWRTHAITGRGTGFPGWCAPAFA